MGTVELVTDAGGERLARKRLTASTDARALLAFRREFHTLATLEHPSIVTVREFGLAKDGAWYTMEYLDGDDLYELGAVEWPRACEILRQVASALSFLHSRRLIHRDIKPRNIKLDAEGNVRLIDFGVMTTFGSSPDIAGTPAYMAPESVAGLPLDQRVDLYSLGALGYWLLTGTNAIAARKFEDLTAAWSRRPASPSHVRPEIPPRLDELVLSLLARDPLARPGSAHEVIERLVAIAGLTRVESPHAANATLTNTALIGREREVELIERVVNPNGAQEAATLLLAGASGMGKSRLLREAVLRGQLTGGVTVEIACTPELSASRPYAAMATFADGLLARDREATLEAARPVAEALAPVLPELAAAAGAGTSGPEGDAGEARLRAIDAVRTWLRALPASVRPIAIVDDLQWCDEGSASLFAGLQQSASKPALLIVAALRTDVPAVAHASVRSLRESGRHHRLRGLSAREVRGLARTMFGEAMHLEATASWLHEASGGSPMLCIDLAHHLVEGGHARNVDGLWLLPEDPASTDVPSGLAAASEARVARLPEHARRVAEAIAILGRSAPTAMVHALAELGYDELFNALDELIARDVIGEDRDALRITHDALREALLRCMSDDARRDLHQRAARSLDETSDDPTPAEEARLGWHWLRGGDELRGAELLASAGERTIADQAATEAIPLMSAALEAYERLGVREDVQFRLRHKLLLAGAMTDLPLLQRVAPPTLELAWRLAAFDRAQSIARVLGRPLGVMLAMSFAWLRWLVLPSVRRIATPMQASELVFVALYVLAASASHRDDRALAKSVRERLRLFTGLRIGVPYAMAMCAESFLYMAEWRPESVMRAGLDAAHALERDRITPIGEFERRAAMATAYNTGIFVLAFEMSPKIFERFDKPKEFGLRVVDMSHALIEACYHHARGETPQARSALARFERDQTAMGRSWMWDGVLAWHATIACAWNRDVLGLRRSIARLEGFIERGFKQRAYVALARGEYHRERGDLGEARRILEALEAEVGDHSLVALGAPVALAETLLAMDELEPARAAAERGLKRATSPAMSSTCYEVRCRRALALIHGATGDDEDARRELKLAHEGARISDSPTLVGSLHEAEAHLAYAGGDLEAYREACDRVRTVYGETDNPILIARAERLATLGQDAITTQRRDVADLVTVHIPGDPVQLLRDRVSAARSVTQRYAAALDVLIEVTDATAGYAFVYDKDGMPELVAPDHGEEPPREVESLVLRREPVPQGTSLGDGWWVATLGRPPITALALRSAAIDAELLEPFLAALSDVFSSLRGDEASLPRSESPAATA